MRLTSGGESVNAEIELVDGPRRHRTTPGLSLKTMSAGLIPLIYLWKWRIRSIAMSLK
jgi:hypothetical protein